MPKRCCVPMCSVNYDTVIKTNGMQSVYAFPKDEELKAKWVRAINRADWKPTNYSYVCKNHFVENDFRMFQIVNGKETVELLKVPKLREGSIPSVFPNQPSYLSKAPTIKRKDPNLRRNEIIIREELVKLQEIEMDRINGFSMFEFLFEQRLDDYFKINWKWFLGSNSITFYTLKETDLTIDFHYKININNEMKIKISINEMYLKNNQNIGDFSINSRITTWSQIKYILDNIGLIEADAHTHKYKNYLQSAIYNFKYVLNDDEFELQNHLKFLIEQLELMMFKKVPRYPPSMIVAAFVVFTSSSSTYELVRQFLILPHKRQLQLISSSLNISPDLQNSDTNNNYLAYVVKSLTERERIVNLMIDEIYIKSGLNYKSQKVTGYSENKPLEVARTVQVFMIESSFGGFTEVIRLYPVCRNDGNELLSETKAVISFIQNIGFKVLCIITDNNRINQSLFRLLVSDNSEDFSFPNPQFEEEKIFTMYDPVHIVKNIKSNWIGLKTFRETFMYPDFETFEIKKAEFCAIKDLYEKESQALIKQAFKLNFKTMYPTVFERQNVRLFENIVHPSTISALYDNGQCETADFLSIIRKWWDIMNTKGLFKNNKLINPNCAPFYSASDERIIYFENFISWLKVWNEAEGNVGVLTRDTYKALYHTTTAILNIIKYSFNKYDICYILPGKFQSDNLEARFGLYRRLSGTNYHISLNEIMESEKKIRIRKIFSHEELHENIDELKEALIDIPDIDGLASELFDTVVDTYYLRDVELEPGALTYESGYASFSTGKKVSCITCKTFIIADKGIEIDNSYFDFLQRGGLAIPTDQVKILNFHMNAVFQEVCRNNSLSKKFFENHKHKLLLIAMTLKSIFSDNYQNQFTFDRVCDCSMNNLKLFTMICSPLSNILLNNYCKRLNDNMASEAKARCDRKLKKFGS